jgi:hypothetical protein
MNPRRHQLANLEIATNRTDQQRYRRVINLVTPGGGKARCRQFTPARLTA